MKKFSFKIIIVFVFLALLFIVEGSILQNYQNSKDNRQPLLPYRTDLSNDSNLKNKNSNYINFLPYYAYPTSEIKKEKEYMNTLVSKLDSSNYIGYLENKIYFNTQYKEAYVYNDLFKNIYTININEIKTFNYFPDNLNDITVYVGINILKKLENKDFIDLKIFDYHKTKELTIKAKIVGDIEKSDKNNIYGKNMADIILISDFSKLVDKNLINYSLHTYRIYFKNNNISKKDLDTLNKAGKVLPSIKTLHSKTTDHKNIFPTIDILLRILLLTLTLINVLYILISLKKIYRTISIDYENSFKWISALILTLIIISSGVGIIIFSYLKFYVILPLSIFVLITSYYIYLEYKRLKNKKKSI